MKNLPVGSVVKLQDENALFMIMAHIPTIKAKDEEVYFDYSGVPLPAGYAHEKIYLFNDEQIDTVMSLGYVNQDFFNLQENINQWKADNELKKGDPYMKMED